MTVRNNTRRARPPREAWTIWEFVLISSNMTTCNVNKVIKLYICSTRASLWKVWKLFMNKKILDIMTKAVPEIRVVPLLSPIYDLISFEF